MSHRSQLYAPKKPEGKTTTTKKYNTEQNRMEKTKTQKQKKIVLRAYVSSLFIFMLGEFLNDFSNKIS